MFLLPLVFSNLNALIVAQVPPGSLGEGSSIVQDGADASAAIATAMDDLWNQVLGGALYSAIAQLGLFFAVGTLLLFMVQWFKDLMDGDNPRAFTEIIGLYL